MLELEQYIWTSDIIMVPASSNCRYMNCRFDFNSIKQSSIRVPLAALDHQATFPPLHPEISGVFLPKTGLFRNLCTGALCWSRRRAQYLSPTIVQKLKYQQCTLSAVEGYQDNALFNDELVNTYINRGVEYCGIFTCMVFYSLLIVGKQAPPFFQIMFIAIVWSFPKYVLSC